MTIMTPHLLWSVPLLAARAVEELFDDLSLNNLSTTMKTKLKTTTKKHHGREPQLDQQPFVHKHSVMTPVCNCDQAAQALAAQFANSLRQRLNQ
jgi:hypothetical protein